MSRFTKCVIVIAAAFGVVWTAQIGKPLAAADEEQAVLQIDRGLGEGLAKADKTAVGALLDENFEWTNSDGKTRTKEEALQNLDAFARTYGSETELKTHNYGQVERIAGTHHNLNFVRLWVKRPAGWRVFVVLEAPLPTKTPHPTQPTPADNACVNPCKTLPFKPATAAQQAALATWLNTKMDEWHAIPDDWETHAGDSLVIFSPTMSMNKAERLALLTKQHEVYGTGSPSPAVLSMRMYDFGNTVIMTAHHGPNAAGGTSYAVRIFTNEDGDWKIVLSAQTDIK